MAGMKACWRDAHAASCVRSQVLLFSPCVQWQAICLCDMRGYAWIRTDGWKLVDWANVRMSGIRTRYAARSTGRCACAGDAGCGRSRPLGLAQSLSLCAQVQQIAGRYRDAHRSQDWPSLLVLARGQQSVWSLAALTEGLLCKSSICRVANACRAGSPFVPCFVLCVLQLLPVQSRTHDAKALSRLLGGRRQSVCTHGHALCQGAHQLVAQRTSGCGHFVNGQRGAVAGLPPQRDFAAQARLPMWRMQ